MPAAKAITATKAAKATNLRPARVASRAVITAAPRGPALPADALKAQAQEAAALLKALGNEDRLRLLCLLVEAERNVTEVGQLAGIEQPTLSQQLAVLRGERLVGTRREGKQVIYRIESAAALAVLQALYQHFCQAPAAAPENPITNPIPPGAARKRKQAT